MYSTTEPFLTKVSVMRIRTPSKNAKMLAPTIIMLVSKTLSLAGVTMILMQSLDMDLLTVVKLEDQNATTSMTTSAKEVCSLPTKFFTSILILLWIDLLIQMEKH
jgi:flagellar biosynthesis protein FlhB